MTGADPWFADRTRGAPPVLRARAEEYLARTGSADTLAARLAEAGALALHQATVQDRAREAALDLLTADSLVTLALLAQAETAPAELERFAANLVGAPAA